MNLYSSTDTTLADILEKAGVNLSCRSMSAAEIRAFLKDRHVNYHPSVFEPHDAVTGWSVGERALLILSSRGWGWYLTSSHNNSSSFQSSELYYNAGIAMVEMLKNLPPPDRVDWDKVLPGRGF